MSCEIQSVCSQIKEPVLPRAQQFQKSRTWVIHINSTLKMQCRWLLAAVMFCAHYSCFIDFLFHTFIKNVLFFMFKQIQLVLMGAHGGRLLAYCQSNIVNCALSGYISKCLCFSFQELVLFYIKWTRITIRFFVHSISNVFEKFTVIILVAVLLCICNAALNRTVKLKTVFIMPRAQVGLNCMKPFGKAVTLEDSPQFLKPFCSLLVRCGTAAAASDFPCVPLHHHIHFSVYMLNQS